MSASAWYWVGRIGPTPAIWATLVGLARRWTAGGSRQEGGSGRSGAQVGALDGSGRSGRNGAKRFSLGWSGPFGPTGDGRIDGDGIDVPG